jgi:hypothetical protein
VRTSVHLQAVSLGYQTSLDGYLQLVVQATHSSNIIQMVLLLVLGVGMCMFLSLWTWLNLSDVAARRFDIYRVFMVRGVYSILREIQHSNRTVV